MRMALALAALGTFAAAALRMGDADAALGRPMAVAAAAAPPSALARNPGVEPDSGRSGAPSFFARLVGASLRDAAGDGSGWAWPEKGAGEA